MEEFSHNICVCTHIVVWISFRGSCKKQKSRTVTTDILVLFNVMGTVPYHPRVVVLFKVRRILLERMEQSKEFTTSILRPQNKVLFVVPPSDLRCLCFLHSPRLHLQLFISEKKMSDFLCCCVAVHFDGKCFDYGGDQRFGLCSGDRHVDVPVAIISIYPIPVMQSTLC